MGRRCVLIALIFVACHAFAQSRWLEVRSPHFTVLTDAGEKQGKQVALRFEQMRNAFGTLFYRSTVNMPVPLQVIAFRSQGEFKKYAPLWKGKPVDVAGYFHGADDRSFIALDMSSNDPYGAVFHEYAHLLLHGNFPVTPLWFDEGFAEYFSSLRVDGDKVEYGAVPSHLPAVLQANRWMPILDLLSAKPDSDTYNERDKRGVFYAQSWITVHYLMSNQKLPEAANYLQLTQVEHKPIAESLKQAFGMEPAVFEKAVRDYFNGTGKYYRAEAPQPEPIRFTTRKIDDLTAQAILADLHAHSRDYTQLAELEFQAVLEKDPNHEIATRGLGYLYLRKNEFDKAAALFRRASIGESKDARLHYLNALLMNRMAMETGTPPDDPDAMQKELETAIQLDPTMADAYNLLAYALAAKRDYDKAISAQKKAIELYPSHETYQVNLARIYLQSQQWDNAQALLVRLQLSSDPAVQQNAKDTLASLQASRELAAQLVRDRELRREDITAPQWRRKNNTVSTTDAEVKEEAKPDTRKVLYLYGSLQSVDCSEDPAAVLNVRRGSKLMRLRTSNYKKLLLMGADSFSCNWKDKKVLVNYKPGGKADGDVVTLELQQGK